MIYLSAQPDQYYFLWQLQLQLFNFIKLGINPNHIHILIGFEARKGLSIESKKFILDNALVNVHVYEDTRLEKNYLSSVRPHIIAKHLKAFPDLERETIFYHDSDIIFSALPDFKQLVKNDTWYVSDTRSYLDTNYIMQTSDANLFNSMCEIVGVKPEQVLNNDANAGGAQYIIKKSSVNFWEKVESDCEKLFKFLSHYKAERGFREKANTIDPWVTDMWVLWWNALLLNKEFKVHKELEFSWADSPISEWTENKILHYTGHVKLEDKTIFRKNNYFNCSPFFDDFSKINKNICSSALVQTIKEYNKQAEKKRVDLKDVSFLITVRVDSQDRLENIYAVTKYLFHHFDTNILLLEIDSEPKLKKDLLHEDVNYSFVKDKQIKLHRTKYNNVLIQKATTPYISIYDADIIIPISQIVESVEILRSTRYHSVLPYDGNCCGTDVLLKAMFIKILDEKLLVHNANKQSNYARRAVGGSIFLNKSSYSKIGYDNEKIKFWGPEDIERIKRMKILGYETKRVRGPLFHLHHERYENSGYQNLDQNIELMNEYLRVANSSKSELEEYIKTWDWKC
ncbi:galactosyltransferase-related protein [Pedobacter fastidiosus]|uniref:Galactosyltransferase C-terminal domain-containing protein n=1 Tax=Pedobacter fastidiosus TaxID=2765361 RepID=A0ABR7KWP2_9SPHI|nr:galactosyltransferase-related protein [Pedobacter fastidiosus]MBC6112438.1 hypothetical protein [Pedobacter fastidiosus]